tara:strand:+ start:57 stop:1004 length:948 start_codon:yes stop_codon:yes gene_type:complete
MRRQKPSVKVVRKTLADGTVREYLYPRAEPKAPRQITVDEVIAQYRMAPEFRRLSKSAKTIRLRAFDKIKAMGATPIAAVKRRHVLGSRDAYADTPGIANQVITAWSVLLNFAVDREMVDANPARGVKALDLGEHKRWPEDTVTYATTPGTLPEPIRRAVVLALYTGQRQGDCLSMRWGDYDGAGIAVTQQKTGAKLWVACHESLRAELDAWPRTAATILTSSTGKPWAPSTFAPTVSKVMRAHVEFTGLVFHGLRKVAAARLAEAGCSIHEIAAVTGHQTLQMLALYTREAGQRDLATAAIRRLETGRKDRASN